MTLQKWIDVPYLGRGLCNGTKMLTIRRKKFWVGWNSWGAGKMEWSMGEQLVEILKHQNEELAFAKVASKATENA